MFKAEDVLHFAMDPSRAASVPMAVFEGVTDGVLSVDRYAAYRKYVRGTPGVKLALCWAHQRRDFLQLANQYPEHAYWALQWIDQIAELYAHHGKRQRASADQDSVEFMLTDARVRALIDAMQARCQAELAWLALAPAIGRVLRSMQKHWPDLITFLDHPEIDLDNNAAERAIRPAVVGRKNYYGSGSQVSGQLAAMMLSLFGTLDLWQINPHTWLTDYLQACAQAGGGPRPNYHTAHGGPSRHSTHAALASGVRSVGMAWGRGTAK